MNLLIDASLHVIGNTPLSNLQQFTTSVQRRDTLANLQFQHALELFIQTETI